jgi:type VI secretion system protein ImpE
MRAEALVRTGDIDGALAALQAEVRARPAEARLRVFLFQLLAVIGDWKRAVTQLKVAAELDGAALPMAQAYREAIVCEVLREKVFAAEKDPLIFGEPQEWVALLVQAGRALAAGRGDEAADLRERAFEGAPEVSGTLNGAPFAWIADADMRLGPVLEAVVNGRYFWVPFGALARITAEPPRDLRDCVWTPATLTLRNGGEVVALIPTRYPGTAARGTPAQKLSRATGWAEAPGGAWIGLGQRTLATDAGDSALMDLRELTIGGAA